MQCLIEQRRMEHNHYINEVQSQLARNILAGRRASLVVSPVRKMVASTKENLARATAGQGKVKALNTEKLFQQQPTFYNFSKVFGNQELSH